MADTQIRESVTLRQRICDAYDEAHLSFTDLEYCLCEPKRRESGGYYHQYWEFWKFFHLVYFLTYHESKMQEKVGDKDFEKLNHFFDCRNTQDLNKNMAYEIIRLWKIYDKSLRCVGVISLES